MSKQKKYTLKKIGRLCGNRDQATILHSIRTINNLIEFDKKTKHDYQKLKSKILIEITEQEKTEAIINGCGYEIGWDCEELTYQTAQNLQRATQLNNLLKPNCFIPVVIHRHFYSNYLKTNIL